MNKIKQEYIIASVALLLLGTVFVSSYFGSLGGEKYIKNNQAGALCSLLGIFCSCTPEAIPAGSIVSVDNENNTIEMTVPYGLSSMCFVPNIQTVYSKAVVTPDRDEPQDFTNPVTYTIDQDGFIKSYVVSVKLEPPTPIISTCQELQKINNNLSGDYILANNIDCSDTQNWNNGEGFKPIGGDRVNVFMGSFDGKGYTISNLYINRPTEENVGLFGGSDTNISNVGLVNVNINGYRYVGGLVGLQYAGIITNSYSTGKVTVNDSYVGGLVGLSSGDISSSYSSVMVNRPDYSPGYAVGGLVGGLSVSGKLSNSFSTGDVFGGSSGGLVGHTWSGATISNSYSTGKVNNQAEYNGGLIGHVPEGVIIENSYWDTQTSGQTTSAGGEGKTTLEMKTTSTFVGWDTNIWNLVSGQYPTLKTVSVYPATVSLNASSTTVVEGNTSVLTWTPTNSISCTAGGNDQYWDGSSLDATDGPHTWTTEALAVGTHTYNISCTGNNGTATATATVIAEHPVCSSFTYSTWSTCSGGTQTRTVVTSSPADCTGGEPVISQSCASPLEWSPALGTKSWTEADAFCKNPANDYQRLPTLEEGKTALADQFLGGGNNPGGFSISNIYWTGDSIFNNTANTLYRYYYYYWSGYINYGSESGDGFPRNFRCVREPKTLVSLNTSASTVVEGDTAVITWTPTNSNSCTAGGNDPYWAGSSLLSTGGSHTWTTEALAVGTHTYNISCTGNNGTANATVVVTATPISTGGGATGGGGTGGGTIAPVSFDGGTGTESDPYQISDWKQLNSVRSKLSSYYILTSDLTSSSGGYADFGNNWTPIGNSGSIFNGRFNGNGKTISNLKINSSSAYYVGLFGYSTGNISNLGLIDITIISNSNYVGALVGLMGSGEINQSYSTGNISGLNYVGGLVGQQSGGEISNSYSSVNITNFTSNAGGLVGKQDTSGIITNSYSTGILSISTGDIPYGGLIGYQNPSDFYSSLKRVTGSYWDKNTSGLTGSAAGEGKTTTEMQTPSTFSGWDADIWTLVAGNYPTLDPSSLYIEPIVPVEPVVIINTADLNCTLSRISPPLTSSNEVSVNNNTVWKASSTCPTCTVNWSVTDTNNPNPTMTPGTNPWNKIFTTIGSKIVSAQFVSPGGTPGTTCTATTTVVQTGGGTEL